MGPRCTWSFLSGFFAVTFLGFSRVGACVVPVPRYLSSGNGEQSGKAGAQGRRGGRESRAGVPSDDVGSEDGSQPEAPTPVEVRSGVHGDLLSLCLVLPFLLRSAQETVWSLKAAPGDPSLGLLFWVGSCEALS